MGKHEAPSTNTKPSAGKKAPPKHAAPGSESKRFPLDLPELKIPEKLKNIELPKLKLPKLPNFKDLPKPKLPAFLRREEDDDEYEDEDGIHGCPVQCSQLCGDGRRDAGGDSCQHDAGG